jgi:hypothetical protein
MIISGPYGASVKPYAEPAGIPRPEGRRSRYGTLARTAAYLPEMLRACGEQEGFDPWLLAFGFLNYQAEPDKRKNRSAQDNPKTSTHHFTHNYL